MCTWQHGAVAMMASRQCLPTSPQLYNTLEPRPCSPQLATACRGAQIGRTAVPGPLTPSNPQTGSTSVIKLASQQMQPQTAPSLQLLHLMCPSCHVQLHASVTALEVW